jgi:endonuclease/exonuclease/phosphatase family metal-dependent hydrolase
MVGSSVRWVVGGARSVAGTFQNWGSAVLQVVNLNLGGCSNGKPRNQAGALKWFGSFLRDLDADVLLLQEVYNLNWLSGFRGNQAEKLQPLTGHPYKVWEPGAEIWRFGVKIGTGGTAIFSKLPIMSRDFVRGIVRATVTYEDDPLQIFCVHYPHPETEKMHVSDAATRMMDALGRTDRIIFGGDFNAGSDHPAWLKVRDGGGLNDTFDSSRGDQWCGPDSSGHLHDHIDHILVRGFETERYACLVDPPPRWSDHTAVRVELRSAPVIPEPAECDELRATFRRERPELERLRRRLADVMHHKPIDQDAAAELREQISSTETDMQGLLARMREIGCYDVAL